MMKADQYHRRAGALAATFLLAMTFAPPAGAQVSAETDEDVQDRQERGVGAESEAARPLDRSAGNPFLANLSEYAPIYGVYGPGTNTAARLQLSLKYRLFGRDAGPDAILSGGYDGIYFAYTQRMFWDLEAESLPFRNIDFEPELFYAAALPAVSRDLDLGVQVGIRHTSNGQAGEDSRSVNTVYVQPAFAVRLGETWRLRAGPRFWTYVGSQEENEDIDRFRGHTGVFAELGDPEGLRISGMGRMNLSTGKGSFETLATYPLPRLLGGGPELYLTAQGFRGYGENLLDYDQKTTRLRIGLALVR
ncbi:MULTISPECIES: phospholipase A [Pacificimonas]|nr:MULTISPECIES: phospholipase A [Pacificimonas]